MSGPSFADDPALADRHEFSTARLDSTYSELSSMRSRCAFGALVAACGRRSRAVVGPLVSGQPTVDNSNAVNDGGEGPYEPENHQRGNAQAE